MELSISASSSRDRFKTLVLKPATDLGVNQEGLQRNVFLPSSCCTWWSAIAHSDSLHVLLLKHNHYSSLGRAFVPISDKTRGCFVCWRWSCIAAQSTGMDTARPQWAIYHRPELKKPLCSLPQSEGKDWIEEMLPAVFYIDSLRTFQSPTPSLINTCRVKALSSCVGAVTLISDTANLQSLLWKELPPSKIFCSFSLPPPSSKICQNRLHPIHFLLLYILFSMLSQPPLAEVSPWGNSCPLYFLLCVHNRTLSA